MLGALAISNLFNFFTQHTVNSVVASWFTSPARLTSNSPEAGIQLRFAEARSHFLSACNALLVSIRQMPRWNLMRSLRVFQSSAC